MLSGVPHGGMQGGGLYEIFVIRGVLGSSLLAFLSRNCLFLLELKRFRIWGSSFLIFLLLFLLSLCLCLPLNKKKLIRKAEEVGTGRHRRKDRRKTGHPWPPPGPPKESGASARRDEASPRAPQGHGQGRVMQSPRRPPGNCRRKTPGTWGEAREKPGTAATQPPVCPHRRETQPWNQRDGRRMFKTMVHEDGIFWNNVELMYIRKKHH